VLKILVPNHGQGCAKVVYHVPTCYGEIVTQAVTNHSIFWSENKRDENKRHMRNYVVNRLDILRVETHEKQSLLRGRAYEGLSRLSRNKNHKQIKVVKESYTIAIA